jgi:hypothetical protein
VKATDKQEMSERVQYGQGEGPQRVYVTHVVINTQQSAVLCSQMEVFPSFLNLFRKIHSNFFSKLIAREMSVQN